MPAGASEPSAGDAGNTAALEPQGTKRGTYKCPEDFVSFTHKPCSSTLKSSLRNRNSELWLIKAPASFNPQQFNGVTVPLSGLQTVRVAAPDAAASGGGGGGARQCVYSVLGSARTPPDLHLLTADGTSLDRVVCGPAFSGVLNVCEMHGDGGRHALLHPQAIPAAPAPAIPPGLKQRFLPFGSKMPTLTYVGESELDAGAAGPSSATLRPLVVKCFPAEEEEMTEEERRKERKRRRREKRIKLESQDPGEEEVTMVAVKTEPVGPPFQTEEEEQQSVEAGLPYQEEGRRKKKKRKKDKENERDATQAPAPEEVPGGYEEEEKEEEVTVKCEPMDIAYEDPEGSAKKKKKKRKSRVEEA